MTPEARTARTLRTLDAGLVGPLERVLAAMAALGWPMVAYDGRRTTAQQQRLYAQGRTVPGRVVTHLDGVTARSRHQDGQAADCAFLVRLGADRWDVGWDGPWEAYGACGEAVGLIWGGRWRMRDRPHLEAG